MTGQIGCLHFDGTAERQWSVPALQIGGLPIALINRANSAQLMLDAALRRRDSILPPLIFSSANGQVLSMCARHSSIRGGYRVERAGPVDQGGHGAACGHRAAA